MSKALDCTRAQTGTLNISESELTGNFAAFGGVVYAAADASLRVSHCSVLYNMADVDGAILFSFRAVSVFTDTQFSLNYAFGRGGVASVSNVRSLRLAGVQWRYVTHP